VDIHFNILYFWRIREILCQCFSYLINWIEWLLPSLVNFKSDLLTSMIYRRVQMNAKCVCVCVCNNSWEWDASVVNISYAESSLSHFKILSGDWNKNLKSSNFDHAFYMDSVLVHGLSIFATELGSSIYHAHNKLWWNGSI